MKTKLLLSVSTALLGILLMGFNNVYGQTYCFTAPQGYGAGATGGGSAAPVTVTTQSALQSALTASGNGVILVSGTITCTYMSVLVTNKTILGLPGARLKNLTQTKDGSGIINIKSGSTNVIIRNLIFEGPGAYDTDGRDNLTIDGGSKIWVDHCEFQDGMDGNYDHKGLTDNVTVSWCKFTYLKAPKAGGSGGTDDHRFSDLVGSSDSDKPSDGKYSITWQYCWWAQGCVERMTRARNAQLHMLNCYWNSTVAKVALGLGGVTDCYVENSTFANTGDKYRYYDNGTVRLTTAGCTAPPANVGTCPAPTYTHEAISASAALTAVTSSCGAGATLNITSSGSVSAGSSCGGTPVNQAPTVSITSPANNATFTAPASVTINANAADADGSVSKVDFYNGSTLLGTDASSPYSFAWANIAAGTYSITAKATDNSGAVTTSSVVSIVVNAAANTPPTVSITSPANNATFTAPASVTINANAADADGSVLKVDFYNGSTLLGTDASSPYSFSWTNVAAGTYTLSAKATDNAGTVTTSSVVSIVVNAAANTPPTVSITSPANNATFTAPASITINANAADANGSVSNVQFFNGSTLLGSDASSPYSFSWTNVAAGTYTITARATDNSGATTTSSPITVVINAVANTSPTVSITSPANNATFTAPASITINANAADADGSVSNVQFFNGSTSLGSDASSPYSFAWTNIAAGTYTITARATDNSGATTTSSSVTVTVNPLSTTGITIQAETACAVNGILSETKNAGFNGSGYVNVDNATGTAANWVMNSDLNQIVGLTIRFANASANDRSMSLKVNGATQIARVSFPSTGAWTTWTIANIQLNLVSGANNIQLVSLTSEGGPNIDELTFNSTTVTVTSCNAPPVNQVPVVSITAPANNATFTAPAGITITASASDVDGTVSNVQFFNGSTLLGSDATAPFSFAWTNVPAGTYTITASATDNSGAITTSSAVTLVVNAPVNIPPTVSISSPANNTSFIAPASITISANAADANGTVSNVQFFNGSTLLGSDATAPFSFTWTNVAAGTYSITASATDNEGAITSSSPVTVIVDTIQTSGSVTVQAETACSVNGILAETKNAGFHGAAYVNLDNSTGTAVSWVVNSATSQTVTVAVRYANLSANNRNMSVMVNGVTQISSVDFLTTGAWTTWNSVNIQVNLMSGANTIKFTSLMSEGAPNIDELTYNYSSGIVTAGSCSAARMANTVISVNEQSSIAPNPSANVFNITVQQTVNTFTVMNDLGVVVYTGSSMAEGESVSLGEELQSGMYMVLIQYSDGRFETKKIQKTR